MAIGKIYDSNELKRIDSFMSSTDQKTKDLDNEKSDLKNNVYVGLIIISVVIGSVFAVNYFIKK